VRHLMSGKRRRRQASLVDPNLQSVIEEMQRSLGTRVRLLPKARSTRGKIEIEYYSSPDLERIIQTIMRSQLRAG
jgi:ParB family transcriptional regulator, chromosome partitioning protein